MFAVTPKTPRNPNFHVEVRRKNKRKSIYIDEEEAANWLSKPKWLVNTKRNEEQPKKRARTMVVGSTEVIIVKPEKKKPSISAELREFRYKQMHRAGLPREDSLARYRRLHKRGNFQ